MSNDHWNKYKYNGIELGTFTGDYSENSIEGDTNYNPASSFFKNMPIISTGLEAPFSSEPEPPSEFNTNSTDGWQVNKYFKNWAWYDDEITNIDYKNTLFPALPYSINHKNVYQTDFNPDSQMMMRVGAAYDTFNSSNKTGTIPSWCNAIKIYFHTCSGATGTAGNTVAAQHVQNAGFQHQGNHHHDGRAPDAQRNRNRFQDQRGHVDHQYEQANGGAGGDPGDSIQGWFYKYITFTPGTENTITTTFSTSASGTNSLELKSSTTTILTTTTTNGGIGNTGTNGVAPTTRSGENENWSVSERENDDRMHHQHRNRNSDFESGSTHGIKGIKGSTGFLTYTDISGSEYVYYSSGTRAEALFKVFYFNLKVDFRNYNPFSWAIGGSNNASNGYNVSNLGRRYIGSSPSVSDVFLVGAQTTNVLSKFEQGVSPANILSGSTADWYLSSTTAFKLAAFTIYMAGNTANNQMFLPTILNVYAADDDGSNKVLIAQFNPPNIDLDEGLPTNTHYTRRANKITYNYGQNYQRYYFEITQVAGSIPTNLSDYSGPMINYIEIFPEDPTDLTLDANVS
jgi:hypothetical protein